MKAERRAVMSNITSFYLSIFSDNLENIRNKQKYGVISPEYSSVSKLPLRTFLIQIHPVILYNSSCFLFSKNFFPHTFSPYYIFQCMICLVEKKKEKNKLKHFNLIVIQRSTTSFFSFFFFYYVSVIFQFQLMSTLYQIYRITES